MILDGGDAQTGMVEPCHSRFTTRTGPLDADFHFTNTHPLGLRRGTLRGSGRGERSRLSGTLEADGAGESQQSVSPLTSVNVTIVLLKLACTCTMALMTLRRSFFLLITNSILASTAPSPMTGRNLRSDVGADSASIMRSGSTLHALLTGDGLGTTFLRALHFVLCPRVGRPRR